MRIKKVFTSGFFVLILLFFTACSQEQQPIKVGTQPWIGYETLNIAKDLHYLPESVTLVMGDMSTDSVNDLQTGKTELAALTLGEVVLARSKNIPLEIVMVFDVSTGGDNVISTQVLENLSDIKGKRIVHEDSTVGRVMLSNLLKNAGLTKKDVQVSSLSQNKHLDAWDKNTSDIYITYEPVSTKLITKGGYKVFSSKDIPNTIVDVLVAHKEFSKGKEASIKALIKSHFKAIEHINTHYDDALYRIAEYENTSFDDTKHSYSGIRFASLQDNYQLLKNPIVLTSKLEEINALLKKENTLEENVNLDGIFNAKYLP